MVEKRISLDQILPAETVADGEAPGGGCSGCGKGDGSRCGNGLEKIYPTTAVRFGYMRFVGEFSHPPDMKFTCGAQVVIQTRRGLEIGEQVSLTCSGCDKSVTRDEMKQWVDASGSDSYMFDAGRILREATAADLAEHAHIQEDNRERRRTAQQMADRHGLQMKIVECESLFGGERIIFFFTAPERVDFRAMVKDLAQEYRTRIEMRQVGARDEARLLADFETCGREVCCKVFLKTLKPISMRMAKLQKATLDPSQVSGRCGRLKCCLRYEHTGYEELDKKLPRNGVRISTEHGDGVVVNRQVLTQIVQIRKDDATLLSVVAEDITGVNVPPPPEKPPDERPPRGRSTGRRREGGPAKSGEARQGDRKGRGERSERSDRERRRSGGRGSGRDDGTGFDQPAGENPKTGSGGSEGSSGERDGNQAPPPTTGPSGDQGSAGEGSSPGNEKGSDSGGDGARKGRRRGRGRRRRGKPRGGPSGDGGGSSPPGD